MKNTLRFLIFTLCLVFSISAFADRRGADLFKPAGNRTSPSQWTRSNSGNNFSYSRYGGQSYSGYSDPYGQQPAAGRRSFYGSSADQSAYTGYTGQQYAMDDFLEGNSDANGRQGQQRVRGKYGNNNGTAIFDLYEKNPVSDAIPFVVALAMAFASFKFYRSKSRVTE